MELFCKMRLKYTLYNTEWTIVAYIPRRYIYCKETETYIDIGFIVYFMTSSVDCMLAKLRSENAQIFASFLCKSLIWPRVSQQSWTKIKKNNSIKYSYHVLTSILSSRAAIISSKLFSSASSSSHSMSVPSFFQSWSQIFFHNFSQWKWWR